MKSILHFLKDIDDTLYLIKLYRANKHKIKREQNAKLYEIKYGHAKIKRSIKYNKAIVLLNIVAVIMYTYKALSILSSGYLLDATLTTMFFTFFSAELLSMAGIKINDTIQTRKQINMTTDYDKSVG